MVEDVPFSFVLCKHLPLGMISDDPFVYKAANVEALRPELRHDEG
jgi:hypothetical protein